MHPKHLMLDLETYDTATTAIVLSIGISAFDPNTLEEPVPLYYRALNTVSQAKAGRTTSQSTLDWWAKQSPEARTVLSEEKRMPSEVLGELMVKIRWHEIEGIWGNGSDFDLGILKSLFETYGLSAPWKHYHARCYRTLRAMHEKLHEATHGANPPEADRLGTHHNALDDAMHQARNLQFICHTNGWQL